MVDYIAEVLKHLRTEDFTGLYKQYFEISSEVSTRDQTGFEKTFSGLMKIIHPDGKATPDEISELLEFAMECRRRVREQILRIDATFKPNDFDYKPLAGGAAVRVQTPEEKQYPQFASLRPGLVETASVDSASEVDVQATTATDAAVIAEVAPDTSINSRTAELKEYHLVVPENSKGWSYRRIFGDYLKGCTGIIIKDPYIRAFHQIRNLVEFLRMVNELTPQGDEVTVHLVTGADSDAPEKFEKQMENLNQVKDSFAETATPFSFEFDASPNFHARSITTNHGWKISLDRGLDIFQWFESSAFNAATNLQEARLTKGCEVSFIRVDQE